MLLHDEAALDFVCATENMVTHGAKTTKNMVCLQIKAQRMRGGLKQHRTSLETCSSCERYPNCRICTRLRVQGPPRQTSYCFGMRTTKTPAAASSIHRAPIEPIEPGIEHPSSTHRAHRARHRAPIEPVEPPAPTVRQSAAHPSTRPQSSCSPNITVSGIHNLPAKAQGSASPPTRA